MSFPCIFSPPEAQPLFPELKTTLASTETPDTSIIELDCDFETSNCLWSNNLNNTKSNWTISKASDNLNIFAPSTDHSLGSNLGSYLSLNSQTYFPKASVLFSSPLMNGTKCVAFW